jgi:hypothetical protein
MRTLYRKVFLLGLGPLEMEKPLTRQQRRTKTHAYLLFYIATIWLDLSIRKTLCLPIIRMMPDT